MFWVEGGFIVEQYSGKVTGQFVVMLLGGGVESGVVHPPKGAAVVCESQDVWVRAFVCVVGYRKFDGDNGGNELQNVDGRSAAEFWREDELPGSALHGDPSKSPGTGVRVCCAGWFGDANVVKADAGCGDVV